MTHVNNFNFSESKFALLFQHTTVNIFGGKTALILMKEWSIHNEYIKLGFEK